MALLPASGGLGAGLSLGGGAPIPMRVDFRFFFDRPKVQNALSRMEHKALYKAGSVVMQLARRSITKKGMAKPKLKVQKENPNVTMRELIGREPPNSRNRRQLMKRLLEIQAKPASQPGTPPHTHTGIFRRDIVYAFDSGSSSVVIGQFMQGGAWLASLHEFGGTEQLQGWAWVPRWSGSYRAGIIGYWRTGRRPRNTSRWAQTSFRKTAVYPARPYMRPAMDRAIASGRIAEQFRNRFKVGGG